MLREAFAPDLPAWVFKRRKMGFAVPIGEWFRDKQNAVRAMLHDSLTATDSFASGHFRMETVRKFEEALAEFRARRFTRAWELFLSLSQKGDPPSEVYVGLCERYRSEAPPADWDGSYQMEHK
jgi:asparagine synthetase B (glutamine-hydrolysing)